MKEVSQFAVAVRSIVKKIPRGKTMSYGDVAQRAGYPGAARAVGTLMKKNIDPSVPCHRVICADGSLGAYNRGGTVGKYKRLHQEGVHISSRMKVLY